MKKFFGARKFPALVFLILMVSFCPAHADNLEYVTSMFWSGINDLYIQDNYAYCAFENGLEIVDISNLDSPVLVSRMYFQGRGRDVYVADGYAYLADYQSGLKIIDVHDPANPVYLATVETSFMALAVCGGGNHVYVADATNDLQIIDVSDPANPVLENPYHAFDWIANVYFANDLVFAVINNTSSGNVLIIDVSDPGDPILLDNYNTSNDIGGIRVAGDELFLAGDDYLGLSILDISDPTTPSLVGQYGPGEHFEALAIYGDYAYLASYSQTYVVDISNRANPTLGRIYDWDVDKIEISGEYIFGTNRGIGISIVNLADPVNPALRSRFYADWGVSDVCIEGPYAYVATGGRHGLCILDISSPENPIILGNFEPEYGFRCLTISGNHVYAVSGGTFFIIDVSDPTDPVLEGECTTNQLGMAITIQGDYAYVTDYNVDIVNISDPQQPFLVSSIQTPGYALSVTVWGNYAFIADADSGMCIYDISEHYSPRYVTTYPVGEMCLLHDVSIQGDYAYLALDGRGLRILDISDPSQPRFVAQHAGAFSALDVFAAGDLAYVIDYWNGLMLFDISDPYSPEVIAEYQIPGMASQVFPSGDYAYVSAGESMMILRLTTTGIEDETKMLPRDFALGQNYPNPFNTRTVINYNLPNKAYVTLDIYDMLGRKVETLLSIEQTAGVHSVEWNAGNYASGLYFYKLEAEGINETRKAILIK